jgi:hypothetical protein
MMRRRRFCLLSLTSILLPLIGLSNAGASPCDIDRSIVTIETVRGLLVNKDYDCTIQACSLFVSSELSHSNDTLAIMYQYYGYAILRRFIENKDEASIRALECFKQAYRLDPSLQFLKPLEELQIATDLWNRAIVEELDDRRRQCDSLVTVYRNKQSKRKLFQITTGVAAVGATVVTILAHKKSNDEYDKYQTSIAPGDITSHWDKYESAHKVGNIALISAGVFAIAEGVLFLVKPHSPDCNPQALALTGDNNSPVSFGVNVQEDGIRLNVELAKFW